MPCQDPTATLGRLPRGGEGFPAVLCWMGLALLPAVILYHSPDYGASGPMAACWLAIGAAALVSIATGWTRRSGRRRRGLRGGFFAGAAMGLLLSGVALMGAFWVDVALRSWEARYPAFGFINQPTAWI